MEGPWSSPLQSFSTYCYICDMPTNNSLTTMWSPHCLDRWRREVCLKELPPWFLFSSSSTPSTGHSGLLLWGFSVLHVIRCWMDWTPLGWSSSTVSLWNGRRNLHHQNFVYWANFRGRSSGNPPFLCFEMQPNLRLRSSSTWYTWWPQRWLKQCS